MDAAWDQSGAQGTPTQGGAITRVRSRRHQRSDDRSPSVPPRSGLVSQHDRASMMARDHPDRRDPRLTTAFRRDRERPRSMAGPKRGLCPVRFRLPDADQTPGPAQRHRAVSSAADHAYCDLATGPYDAWRRGQSQRRLRRTRLRDPHAGGKHQQGREGSSQPASSRAMVLDRPAGQAVANTAPKHFASLSWTRPTVHLVRIARAAPRTRLRGLLCHWRQLSNPRPAPSRSRPDSDARSEHECGSCPGACRRTCSSPKAGLSSARDETHAWDDLRARRQTVRPRSLSSGLAEALSRRA